MKHFYHYIIIILLLSLYIGCSHHKKDELVVGVFVDAPPFVFFNSKGELNGFDIDLIRMIGERMNKKVQFVNLKFNDLLPALQTGKITLAISSLTATQERKNQFDFSQPYLFDDIVAVYKKGSVYTTLDSLQNAIIAVQKGSALESWTRLVNLSHIKNITMNTIQEMVTAIENNKVNILLLDQLDAQSLTYKNNTLGYFHVGTSTDGYAIAMKKDSAYTNQINTIIEQLQKDGTIDMLTKKWLIHN